MEKQELKRRIERLYLEEEEYNRGVSEINKQINLLNNRKQKLRDLLSKNVKYRNILEFQLEHNSAKVTPIFKNIYFKEPYNFMGWCAVFEEYPTNVFAAKTKKQASKLLWAFYAKLNNDYKPTK